MVAGTEARAGKTTVALGLMAYFLEDGYIVQPFHINKDVSRADVHALLCGRTAHALEALKTTSHSMLENFMQVSDSADIAIVDGCGGFFDGVSGLDHTSSTAHIAKLIQSPVLFVMDISRLYGSAAAVMLGFKNFDRDIRIAGVIFNRAQNNEHYENVKKAVEFYSGIEVLGCLFEDDSLALNLSDNNNEQTIKLFAERVKNKMSEHADMEKITNLATRTPALTLPHHIQNLSHTAGI